MGLLLLPLSDPHVLLQPLIPRWCWPGPLEEIRQAPCRLVLLFVGPLDVVVNDQSRYRRSGSDGLFDRGEIGRVVNLSELVGLRTYVNRWQRREGWRKGVDETLKDGVARSGGAREMGIPSEYW